MLEAVVYVATPSEDPRGGDDMVVEDPEGLVALEGFDNNIAEDTGSPRAQGPVTDPIINNLGVGPSAAGRSFSQGIVNLMN